MSTPQTFHVRAFVSLLMTFSFVIVVASGLVLFIQPHGRIAYWTDWRLLGLGKQHWDSIHLSSTTLFFVTSCLHITYNWKLLCCYLKGKVQKRSACSRELVVSAAVVLLFLIGSIAWFQPFSAFFQLNERIKTSWSAARDQPPFGHAEMASIASLCRSQRLELQAALARLSAAGFKAAHADQTVRELADQYRVTPREIFAVLRETGQSRSSSLAPRQSTDRPGRGLARAKATSQQIFQRYAGRGLGRMRLDELCGELGLELEQALATLGRQGISARADQPLRAIAQASGLQPAELLAALCREGGCR